MTKLTNEELLDAYDDLQDEMRDALHKSKSLPDAHYDKEETTRAEILRIMAEGAAGEASPQHKFENSSGLLDLLEAEPCRLNKLEILDGIFSSMAQTVDGQIAEEAARLYMESSSASPQGDLLVALKVAKVTLANWNREPELNSLATYLDDAIYNFEFASASTAEPRAKKADDPATCNHAVIRPAVIHEDAGDRKAYCCEDCATEFFAAAPAEDAKEK